MRHFAKTYGALGFGAAFVVAGVAPALAMSHGGAGMAPRGVNMSRPAIPGARPVIARPNGGFIAAHPQANFAGRPAIAGHPAIIRPHVVFGAGDRFYGRGRFGRGWGQLPGVAAGGGYFAPVAPYYYPEQTQFPTPDGPPSDTPTGYGVTYNYPWVPPSYAKIITLHPHANGRLTQSITVIRPYSIITY